MNMLRTIAAGCIRWTFFLLCFALMAVLIWLVAGGVWNAFSSLTGELVFKLITAPLVCCFFAFLIIMLYESARGEKGESTNEAMSISLVMVVIISVLGVLLMHRG